MIIENRRSNDCVFAFKWLYSVVIDSTVLKLSIRITEIDGSQISNSGVMTIVHNEKLRRFIWTLFLLDALHLSWNYFSLWNNLYLKPLCQSPASISQTQQSSAWFITVGCTLTWSHSVSDSGWRQRCHRIQRCTHRTVPHCTLSFTRSVTRPRLQDQSSCFA